MLFAIQPTKSKVANPTKNPLVIDQRFRVKCCECPPLKTQLIRNRFYPFSFLLHRQLSSISLHCSTYNNVQHFADLLSPDTSFIDCFIAARMRDTDLFPRVTGKPDTETIYSYPSAVQSGSSWRKRFSRMDCSTETFHGVFRVVYTDRVGTVDWGRRVRITFRIF